ncbi:MAG TPA: GNAT family N-acetyltransferase [Terriglobales bacterium]|nr:GNAT family N-acetyltransferase [Terriglobales bacterium]
MTVRTQSTAGQLRLIKTSDLADAYELSTAAGWNQALDDWRMLLDISPRGCFGIEVDGTLVATTTVVNYQKELAWIGMVLTKPEYRHRGFARRLLACALEYADSTGVETIKLDATEQGKPLYEKFGFRAEQPVERWSRPGSPQSSSAKPATGLDATLLGLDREAYVADRASLLQTLTAKSTVYQDSGGFLFTRTGRTTRYLGPCVTSDYETACRLIVEASDKAHDVSWSWDLLPENKEAVALAKEFGFSPQRYLTRMTRGKPLRGNERMIYAIAGFELG